MKEMKPPLYTRAQLATHTNERIGNTTIDEAIARNHEILQLHFFEPLTDPDEYIKLLESIRSSINTPESQGRLEEDWNTKANKHDDEVTMLFQHVKYTCLYLELASAAEQNKARDRAWAFNSYASLMIGEIIERSTAIQNLKDAEKRSERNSKNAQGRNKSTLPLKEEIARLLKDLRPEAGWLKKSAVAAALERPLTDFIERNNISIMDASNIESWLRNWILNDELVNFAWEKNKHSALRRQFDSADP